MAKSNWRFTLVGLVCWAVAAATPASASGAVVPLERFGSIGSAAGQLQNPGAVGISGLGNVYVADSFNNRISEFTASGSFIRAFGFDVIPGNANTGFENCTVGTGCKGGVAGGAAGQLQDARGVAFDAADNLYIAEGLSNRISEFTASGSFIRAFGFDVIPGNANTGFEVCTGGTGCKAGDPGPGPGQLNFPLQPVLDSAGNLYVADQVNHRISEFNTDGPSFVRNIGAFGSGAGQLEFPIGVALGSAGQVFVSETFNERVSEFAANGSFVRAFGFDVIPGNANTGFEVCTAGTTCKGGVTGGAAGQLDGPGSVALDQAGELHVADIQNDRISDFNTASSTFARAFGFDVVPGNTGTGFETCTVASSCKEGAGGTGTGQLENPFGIATDCRAAVWVADTGNGRIQRFGQPGTALPPCEKSAISKCQGKQATIVGTDGKEKLKGTKKADVIVAKGGKDKISAKKGNDRVCAGAGKDKVSGGAGKDRLNGEDGSDRLFGGKGNDTLKGGKGKDKLVGGPDRDKLNGGPGKDTQKQ